MPCVQEGKNEEHEAAWEKIHSAHGILVPGGFGIRGVEGMILAAKYARENVVPYLGICLGMQVTCASLAHSSCNTFASSMHSLLSFAKRHGSASVIGGVHTALRNFCHRLDHGCEQEICKHAGGSH